MSSWTPLGADPAQHHALAEDIPPWIISPLREWFEQEFTHTVRRSNGTVGAEWWKSRMQEYDMASRSTFADDLAAGGPQWIFDHRLHSAEMLRMLDWLAFDNAARGRTSNDRLEEILRSGGSAWKVGERQGVPGLERRVPAGVQTAAEAAMAIPGTAGALLSHAWHAAYGINPDYEKAYAKSIKAVEAAAIPVVSPANTSATLGTVIAQMRSQGNWSLDVTREHGTHSTQQVVLGMAQALWTGQNDRHAGQPGYTPSTQAEAEMAIMLAVPLVQLFSTGAVRQR